MKIQDLVALAFLLLATVPGARAALLAGPITNAANAHTYYLLSHTNWAASEAEARQLGGHLVTINDAAENQWILNTFSPLTGVSESRLWIGLNDVANEGQFVWASGEPVTSDPVAMPWDFPTCWPAWSTGRNIISAHAPAMRLVWQLARTKLSI